MFREVCRSSYHESNTSNPNLPPHITNTDFCTISSIGFCHQILTEKLHMHRVIAKFVSRLSTEGQKENRAEISQEMLASANGNEHHLNIITGD
jgi:hypothetical protein